MKRAVSTLVLAIVISSLFGFVVIADDPDPTHWTGQVLEFDENIDSEEVYGVYNESGDNLIQERISDEDGKLTIDTERYGTGSFEIIHHVSGDTIAEYDVKDQDFSVNADKTEAVDEEVTYNFTSKRAIFDVEISAEDMKDEQLEEAIQVDEDRVENTTEGFTIEETTAGEEVVLNTTPIDEGEYELKWNVTDTIDEDTIPLFTEEMPPGVATFTEDVFVTTQSEKAEISLDLEYTEEVDVQIGRDIYTHNVTLADDNNDGNVSFTFDTSIAGNGTQPVEALDGTDVIEQGYDTDLAVDTLAPISYTMEAIVDDELSSLSVLSVTQAQANSLETFAYPGISPPSDLEELRNKSIESDAVATEDFVAFKVDVSSIYGFLDEPIEGEDIVEGSHLYEEFGAKMTIKESSAPVNLFPREFNMTEASAIFAEEEQQELWVVVKGQDLPGLDSGSQHEIETLNGYTATFEIDSEENDIFEDDVELSSNVSIENTVATPMHDQTDVLGTGDYIVDYDDPTISLETSLMDGREVTVIADTFAQEFLVFDSQEVEDGMVEFNVDHEDLESDMEFVLEVPTTRHNYDFVVGAENVIDEYHIPEEVTPGEEFDVNASVREELPEEEINAEWDISNADNTEDNTYQYSENLATGNEFNATLTMSSDDNRYYEEVGQTITLVDHNGTNGDNGDNDEGTLETPEPTVSLQTTGAILQGESATFETSLQELESVFVSYLWQVDESELPDSDSSTLTTTFDNPGIYNVGVDVTNVEGASGFDSIDITVYRANSHSRAMFDYFTTS